MIAQRGRSFACSVAVAVLVIGSSGCAGHEPAARVRAPAPSPLGPGERAAAVALKQVGVPYRYGGDDPGGFDCSGLVHYSYAHAGKPIPRTTAGQWSTLAPVEHGNVRVGDLLFFRIDGKMSHVGLYVGNGRFVHAPSSGKSVSVDHLGSDYYRHAFIRAGRPR